MNVDIENTITEIQLEIIKTVERHNRYLGWLAQSILANEINDLVDLGKERLRIASESEISCYKTFSKYLWKRNLDSLPKTYDLNVGMIIQYWANTWII